MSSSHSVGTEQCCSSQTPDLYWDQCCSAFYKLSRAGIEQRGGENCGCHQIIEDETDFEELSKDLSMLVEY